MVYDNVMKISHLFVSITTFWLTKLLLFVLFTTLLVISMYYLWGTSVVLQDQLDRETSESALLQDQYSHLFYDDHLKAIEIAALNESKASVEKEYEALKSDASKEKLVKIEEIYSLYTQTLQKIDRNGKVNINTTDAAAKVSEWGTKLLEQKLDELKASITETNSALDSSYQTYLASIAPPPAPPTPAQPSPAPAPPAVGYSYRTVSINRGTFTAYLIKLPLSGYTVKTVSANSEDCKDGCPTKSLATYISENAAYAGINGTYFCPPDYASCAGKVNSYDFALFNSNLGKWLNENTLAWGGIGWGLATFNGSSPAFYSDIASYPKSAVTAGIANFPMLLSSGSYAIDDSKLTSQQKNNRGARGFIGVDSENIYLGIINGATVIDAAYVAQALGATDALNIDGGGSSALYINGSYKVGPGRSLPNAIVLVKR